VVAGRTYCAYLYFAQRSQDEEDVAISNPFSLQPAIQFGLLFAMVLLISRAAQVYVGDAGVYLSSIIAGLADVDAIALSMAELSQAPDGVDLAIASRAIIFAAAANTFAKGGIVILGGAIALRKAILPGYLLMMITGVLAALLLV
jgi:uncharacterized membrane protein (DUF4010 family)